MQSAAGSGQRGIGVGGCFFELIATVFAGIGLRQCWCGDAPANILTGRRLPRWLIPVAAGGGMIAMTISSEYTWFGRTAASTAPRRPKIAATVEEETWFRPWTRLWPYTKRFRGSSTPVPRAPMPNLPDQRLADLYFFGRWSPVQPGPDASSTAPPRGRAVLIDGATFTADGSVADADWQSVPPDEPDPDAGVAKADMLTHLGLRPRNSSSSSA